MEPAISFDPAYLFMMLLTTLMFSVVGVSIYINIKLIQYFYRRFKGKRE